MLDIDNKCLTFQDMLSPNSFRAWSLMTSFSQCTLKMMHRDTARG